LLSELGIMAWALNNLMPHSYLIGFGEQIRLELELAVELGLDYQLHLRIQNYIKVSYGLGVNLKRVLTLC